MFILHCPDGPPQLHESYSFRLAALNDIAQALVNAIADLCERWSEIHGDY